MKIGILTFHSQLNYGGVLQCWALKLALEHMGHDVMVMDRWLDENNSILERGFNVMTLAACLKFVLKCCAGVGDIALLRRVQKTKAFIKENLSLTRYHFVEWAEAPCDLGVDMLVVGSDQIWHCGDWGDPRVYLLDGAPNVPAITYAASIGAVEIPKSFENCFKRGLKRFKALSCRENEAVALCSELGYKATHVVDPTLLLYGLRRVREEIAKSNKLVCYFLSGDFKNNVDGLMRFAKTNKCSVDIFTDYSVYGVSLKRPISVLKFWWLRILLRLSNVRLRFDAGPGEFMDAFREARWVISDSFHALMFSILYSCDVRVLKPVSVHRRKMFGRIEEISKHMDGPLIAENVSKALESFSKGEQVIIDEYWLKEEIHRSQDWLENALK